MWLKKILRRPGLDGAPPAVPSRYRRPYYDATMSGLKLVESLEQLPMEWCRCLALRTIYEVARELDPLEGLKFMRLAVRVERASAPKIKGR